jgi:hypothetical protein
LPSNAWIGAVTTIARVALRGRPQFLEQAGVLAPIAPPFAMGASGMRDAALAAFKFLPR